MPLRQENGEGASRPKLDVPAVPQGREVRVHLSRQGQRQVFKITVVRRGHDENTFGPQNLGCKREQRPWVNQVLNDLSRNDRVEAPLSQRGGIVVNAESIKLHARISQLCVRDAISTGIASDDLEALFGKVGAHGAIATAQVENVLGTRGPQRGDHLRREVFCCVRSSR